MTYQHLSGPSIPGKTQKILKKSPHASKINKFLQGNLRYSHRRDFSFKKTGDHSFSKEDFRDLARRGRSTSLLRDNQKGFSTSAHRFDKKLEYEQFYDTTPGPGSYNLIKKLEDQAEKLKNQTSYSQKTSPQKRNDMSKFLNYSAFIESENLLDNKQKGTFGRSQRKVLEVAHSPGPCDYASTNLELESKRKRTVSHKIKEKRPALKLPFSLSNPLNYVNSYTVNVYYKPGFPGVG